MAKEILLIGVGPDGRDSLMAQTLEQIKGCNLIIGGKRVISQFEDMDIPTYAMTANLRQLADVINSVEAAVTEGRVIELPAPRRAGDERAGNDDGDGDGDGDEEGDDEPSDDTPRAEGGREGGRRRGRRRPSPRNRGRRNERDGGGRDDKTAEGTSKSADTKAEGASAPASDGGGEPGPKSVLDAGDSSQSFSIEVGKLQAPEEPEADLPEGTAAVAVDETIKAETADADAETADAASDESAPDTTDTSSVETDQAVVTPEAETPADSTSEAAPEAPVAAGTAATGASAKGTKDETAVVRIAVLVSGDPNFYGLSKFLLERFKKEELTVVPHVSAMQLAFAAIKEPMNDAAITSSAGRNVDRLIRVVRQNAKVGIFTDKRRSPRAVAKLLCKHDVEAQCYVCQDLGTPRERIVMGTLEEIAKKNFSPLSIMILFKSVDESAASDDDNRDSRDNRGNRDQRDDRSEKGGRGRSGAKLRELPEPTQAPKYELVTSLGVPDEMLAVRPENIMRSEMRVIVLSKLRLQKDSRMWDVGASCGALSVEAARVAHEGEVLAVERDFSQIRNIYENIKGFALSNVTVMEGDIETLAAGLPEPDRIFIGGCGGHMHTILKLCLDRLKQGGVLVVNATTLDALTEIKQLFKEQRLKHDMVVVNISRTVERNGLEHLEGFNPGFLLTTTKD